MATWRISPVIPALIAAALGGAAGCFPPDEGQSPPLDRFYFPVGAALSPQATRLYVANSDFDLQFNAGSLQVYDLDALREQVPVYCEADADCSGGRICDLASSSARAATHWCVDPATRDACDGRGERTAAARLIAPGLCRATDPRSFVVGSVGLGAFATDVMYRSNPLPDGRGGRLFVPVRGDATLHWIDVEDDTPGRGVGVELECGQAADGNCDTEHRRGQEPSAENTRGATLPPEPFGLAADARGEVVVVTHQSSGQVSLFENHWSAEGDAPGGPRLQFVLGDLPTAALSIASVPEPALVRESPSSYPYRPAFLLTFRNSPEVRLIRYFDEAAASPARPFLESSRSATVSTNSEGYFSPGIAVDAERRSACEATCDAAADRKDCLVRCAAVPVDVFVTNRTPATLVLGQTQPNGSATSSDDLPRFFDAMPLTAGVSRAVVGDVIDREGNPARRVFLICFDSRRVFIYDPAAHRVEAEVPTGRGPHALAIDAAHGLGYLAHFTDSYLGVVDLDQRHTTTYGKIVLSVGEPSPPRASK